MLLSLRKAESGLKKTYGVLAYLWVGFKALFYYSFKPISVQLDSQPELKQGYYIIIGNGKYYGGEITLTSQASMTDGFTRCLYF